MTNPYNNNKLTVVSVGVGLDGLSCSGWLSDESYRCHLHGEEHLEGILPVSRGVIDPIEDLSHY